MTLNSPIDSLRSIRQFIHHLRKPAPRDSFPDLPTTAIPKQRSSANHQCSDLLPGRIDVQVDRRTCLEQLDRLQMGDNSVFALRAFLWHLYPPITEECSHPVRGAMFIERRSERGPHSVRSAMLVQHNEALALRSVDMALLTECGSFYSLRSINLSLLSE